MNAANDPESESALKFPCVFPIKVMGRLEPDFQATVVALISSHLGDVRPEQVRARASSNSRFVSVTVTILADSREQLDNIYRTLTASAQVLLVL